MSNEILEQKVKEILTNEELMKKLGESTDLNDVREKLRSFGLETTDDELNGIIGAMAEMGKDRELSDDELEQVSGGGGSVAGTLAFAKAAWNVGMTIASFYWGSREKAEQETFRFWSNKFKQWGLR